MSSAQVVIVTGASSGFGRLISETLARKNYRVFATMRAIHGKNAAAAAELRDLAAKESLWLRTLELDVTDDSSVQRAVDSAFEQAGRIDVAVNNAGYGLMGITEAATMEQARRIMDTNFFGPVRVNRAVLPHMRRQRSGLLIHISSGAGRIVVPTMSFYCATKWALEALSEGYRDELLPQGIDSVVIQPGPYRTAVFGSMERVSDAGRTATYGAVNGIADHLLGLLSRSKGNPQDIADAVLQTIQTPFGQRKMRRRVGEGGAGGVDELNTLSEKVQADIRNAFGITAFQRL